MLYICTKFQENISKGFSYRADVIGKLKFTKGHNFAKSVSGVMVLNLCNSTDNALYLYQALRKYLKGLHSYRSKQ